MTPSDEIFGDEKGKLFIGGLSWLTEHDSLYKYFVKYGEIVDCVVMYNIRTKKSRGFGFIKFSQEEAADKVLLDAPHIIDDKEVDVKICNPRHLNQGPIKKDLVMSRKVFVGGLPLTCSSLQLKNVFSQYGKVEEAVVINDSTEKSRGFGFITFRDVTDAEKICKLHFFQINDKQVECKKAQTKKDLIKSKYPTVSHGGDDAGNSSCLQQYLLACHQFQLPYYDYAASSLSEANYLGHGLPWSLSSVGQPMMNAESNRIYQYPSEPISAYATRQNDFSDFFHMYNQPDLLVSPHLTSSLPTIVSKKLPHRKV
ncbi:DgyrCDS4842 [Dimorphilus gyrociliatus]|uniref:DgyrCDS4842 n=1 Tax=Dimorphilus gyrociliatus TaxID=2664684 RepID=A0A7I8VMV8_9ANNE|nr:DgyrCDS4842 [Dimorphilus gyrociliatus]